MRWGLAVLWLALSASSASACMEIATLKKLIGDSPEPIAVVLRDAVDARAEPFKENSPVVARYDAGDRVMLLERRPDGPLLQGGPGCAYRVHRAEPLESPTQAGWVGAELLQYPSSLKSYDADVENPSAEFRRKRETVRSLDFLSKAVLHRDGELYVVPLLERLEPRPRFERWLVLTQSVNAKARREAIQHAALAAEVPGFAEDPRVVANLGGWLVDAPWMASFFLDPQPCHRILPLWSHPVETVRARAYSQCAKSAEGARRIMAAFGQAPASAKLEMLEGLRAQLAGRRDVREFVGGIIADPNQPADAKATAWDLLTLELSGESMLDEALRIVFEEPGQRSLRAEFQERCREALDRPVFVVQAVNRADPETLRRILACFDSEAAQVRGAAAQGRLQPTRSADLIALEGRSETRPQKAATASRVRYTLDRWSGKDGWNEARLARIDDPGRRRLVSEKVEALRRELAALESKIRR